MQTENDQPITERPSAEAAWPKSEEELIAYIREMAEWPGKSTDGGEGYGRCVYAMSYAAVATFRYIASTLGVTGFQASCADMDILAQTRGYKHGFMVLDASNVLYPQYDLVEKTREWVAESRVYLRDEAKKRLADGESMHPNVRAHMEAIANAE